MGQSQSIPSQNFKTIARRATEHSSSVQVAGRFHTLPMRITDDYESTGRVLGTGMNGAVYMAKHSRTDKEYAVKDFKTSGLSPEKKENLIEEVEITLSMDHPHIIRLFDVYKAETCLSLVMECASGGEVLARVNQKGRYSEHDVADTAYQMIVATKYMHEKGCVHRDLKLENFLYERPDSNFLKLIDFGFSKYWDRSSKMHSSLGTLNYVAPEVLQQNYTHQCDLWSLGVIVFILVSGYMPFQGRNDSYVMKLIVEGKYQLRHVVWDRVSANAKDFVFKLLVTDPSKRLTSEQALDHPFIRGRAEAEQVSIDSGVLNALVNFGKASAFRRACMEMMSWSLSEEDRRSVRKAFLAMDKENCGVLHLGQFKKILQDTLHISDNESTRAFHALDVSHNDEVNYSEFLAAMVMTRIQLNDDLLIATFNRFDTDKSGFIRTEDFRTMLQEVVSKEEMSKVEADLQGLEGGKITLDAWLQYLHSCADSHPEAVGTLLDKETSARKLIREPTLTAKKKSIAASATCCTCTCSVQ